MSVSLGKRKERDDAGGEAAGHGSTLFVSNLPYTATSTDLKTLFSDLAPVRSAFVVTEQGSGVSKGVGYVAFAIKEDAQMAFDKINTEGMTLQHRKLRVQWAENKPKEPRDKEAKEQPAVKQPKRPRPAQTAGPRDPLAIRTVVISGLPETVDSKTLWKKVRKLDGAEKVDWPVKVGEAEDAHTAHALFTSPAAALAAVSKLHAHVFKGALLSATLKKRLDGVAKVVENSQKAAERQAAVPTPSRGSRLIVRNLPFNITEQDLRALFLPYGPIYSIDIPTLVEENPPDSNAGEGKRPRIKGFAFVWMLSRKDAEKAMEGCNGQTVTAGLADTLMSDKQKKKKQRREEKKRSAAEVKEEDDDEEKPEEAQAGTQRVIAVDWALSKDKWEKAKAKIDETMQEDVEMADSADGDSDKDAGSGSDDQESEDGSDQDDALGVHDDDGSDSQPGSDDEDERSDEEEEAPVKPTLPPPETGTTVFVRNVPFEATEDELRTLFRAFGPLRYARITMDPELGRSRGTGFACFWNKEDADKAVQQSDILRAETMGGSASLPKKNPFKLPSLLTPDPSASMSQSLVLHGRTLDVTRAVTRDEAGKLKEAGERQREKADKRNMYLLREGIIMPNTPASEGLSSTEVEKRTQSFNARRALLRSNPSLYVSRTRLSVRQLPIFVTERMLKRLAVHACRAFEKEVKEGKRTKLSDDELIEPVRDEEDSAQQQAAEARKRAAAKGKGRDTGVKQAKIVRQAERVDPVTGKGRSKGYGFIEMTKHADALRVLRWANNNPLVGPLFDSWWKTELEDMVKVEKGRDKKDEARLKRLKDELEKGAAPRSKGTLIVEFSIENVQVVQRRAAMNEKRSITAPQSKQPHGKNEDTTERSPKKRRTEKAPKREPSVEQSKKAGGEVGSLIGRKRKERQAKRQKAR